MFQNTADGYSPPLYGHILIVENDPVQQQIIHLLLRKIGLSTSIIFADEKTLSNVDKRQFDAILIDSVVHFVDCVKLIQRLREARFSNPIFILNETDSLTEPYIEAGCNGFCSKPVDQQQLYNTLKPYLACNSPAGRNNPMVSSLLANRPESKQKVVEFVQRLPAILNQIRKLYRTEQWHELIDYSHDLCGTDFGFSALESCSRSFEKQIRNHDFQGAQNTLNDLQIICQRIYLGVNE